MNTQFKHLKENEVSKLGEFERKTGGCVLAYEPKVKVSDLTADELKELQRMEKELNAVLVAYNC